MKSKSKNPTLDSYHYHEALDRCDLMAEQLYNGLCNHPVVNAYPKIQSKILKAVEELHVAYQLLGSLKKRSMNKRTKKA